MLVEVGNERRRKRKKGEKKGKSGEEDMFEDSVD